MSEFAFNSEIEIKDFQIPGNNVIIKGLPQSPKSQMTNEMEILQSRLQLLEEEIQTSREDAYKEGFEACRKTLEDESKQALEKELSVLKDLKSDLERQISETVLSLHEPILDLGGKIAEKILSCELNTSDTLKKTINSRIKETIEKLGDQINLNVKMHSDCFDLVNKSNYGKNPQNGNKIKISFTADDSLQYGECIIESEDHIFDGRFKSQIETIISEIN